MGQNTRLLLGNDQLTERITLYDLNRVSERGILEDGLIKSIPCGHYAGLKYRENTVFGDVLLVGGTLSAIYSFSSGDCLWSTKESGNNTHSVEILPGGNLVLVNSSGNDIRLFYTSALLKGDKEGAATFKSFPFFCGHGVLYDPVYECLWVLGGNELAAYRIVGEGMEQTLEPIAGKTYSLSPYKYGGHDLSPDLNDSRYLFVTPARGVLRFDKETGTFSPFLAEVPTIANHHHKSFSQQTDGTYYFTSSFKRKEIRDWNAWWKSSWCADTVGALKLLPDGTVEEMQYYADEAAFYKVRAFCGRYL